ncbi:MAG: alanine racemase, partial [Flavobacteriaceae bacterium]|nr:alanine racemase [Candidatus Onthonaster equi]
YGKGKVGIHGKLAPITGTICMDMMMIDVTDIDCNEGDEVIIFGSYPTLADITKDLDTIPYEVLTSIDMRVNRVYYKD